MVLVQKIIVSRAPALPLRGEAGEAVLAPVLQEVTELRRLAAQRPLHLQARVGMSSQKAPLSGGEPPRV